MDSIIYMEVLLVTHSVRIIGDCHHRGPIVTASFTPTQCRSTPVTPAVIVCIFTVFQPVPAVLWEHFLEEIHATVKQEVVSVNVW